MINSSLQFRENFKGFQSPNYTLIPKAVADSIMQELTTGELRCLLYILNHTFGWKKITDQISISQFQNGIQTKDGETKDRGVGLAKNTLLKSLTSLEDKKLIHRKRKMTRMGDCDATEFSLNFFVEKNPDPKKSWPWKRSSFFQVPDDLFTQHLSTLTGNELKVLLFVARWTSHTENQNAQISIREMTQGMMKKNGEVLSKGTGIHHRINLLKILKKLESEKFIHRKKMTHGSGGTLSSDYSLFGEEAGVVEIEPTGVVKTLPTEVVKKESTPVVKIKPTGVVQNEPHTNTTFTKEYLNTTSKELTQKFYLALGIKPSTKKIEKEKGVMLELLEKDKFTPEQIKNSFSWIKTRYPDTVHIHRLPMLLGLALREENLTHRVKKRLEYSLDTLQKDQEKTKKLIQEFENQPIEVQQSWIAKAPKFMTLESTRKAWAVGQFQKEG